MGYPLTWALVIATYMRPHILPTCLRLAAKQTSPPTEIIVVDGSPDWQEMHAKIKKEFSESFPDIKLIYEKAIKLSSSWQRNQGIKLATTDVLFLIDDDSLMYPNCAEEIMKVYSADINKDILGVSSMETEELPEFDKIDSGANLLKPPSHHPKQTLLRRFVKKILHTRSVEFLPYDGDYPKHILPKHLESLNIGIIPYMTGSRMTLRKEAVEKEMFTEVIKRYGAAEDQDLSYRVSRHGLIVNAIDAYLCHLEISGGRLTTFQVAILEALTPAVLQQFYSNDLAFVNKKWRSMLWKRCFIRVIKNLSERKFSLSEPRGILYAIFKLPEIHKRSGEELMNWYGEFQSNLFDKKSS